MHVADQRAERRRLLLPRRRGLVGPGARWSDVIAAAAPLGLAPLSGSHASVGVTGYTLGGGVGWLSRRYGFAADHLLRAGVVTADGRHLTADAGRHPDLRTVRGPPRLDHRAGVLVLLPLYWQVVRGHGTLATGLLLAPQALGAAVAMPLAGRITDRAGAGVVVPAGIVLGLIGTAVYTQIQAATSPVLLAAALFVVGLGLGATIMPSMAAAHQGLPGHLIPRATSALNTLQRMGASVGTAAPAVILQHEITAQSPELGDAALGPLPDETRVQVAPLLATAFGHAFWVALGIAVLALVPALLPPRTRSRGLPA